MGSESVDSKKNEMHPDITFVQFFMRSIDGFFPCTQYF